MKNYRLNLMDVGGNIITGYQQDVKADSKYKAETDYRHWLSHSHTDFDTILVDVEEISGEEFSQ